jgi:hypothetical protein
MVAMNVGIVQAIHRYPVKSMAGEQLDHVTLDAGGIPGDRAYALRNTDNGKLLSAKLPRIATTLLDCSARYIGSTCVVTVGNDEWSIGDPSLTAALGNRLGCNVAIEHTGGGSYESEWPDIDGVDLQGTHDFPVAMMTEASTFADLAGMHVLTTSSLAAIAAAAPNSAITAQRFRPSVLIDSGAAADYIENAWAGHRLAIGGAVISVTMPTMRCVMTTVAQGDLAADKRILQALAATNRLHFDGAGHFGCLGAYGEVTTGGEISVGDVVTLSPG